MTQPPLNMGHRRCRRDGFGAGPSLPKMGGQLQGREGLGLRAVGLQNRANGPEL